jgi:purine catabolism regulator
VHVSEVGDPTPWLRGGELLMSTGLSLGEPRAIRMYLDRLADHGLAGLAFGTGQTANAPYATVPSPLLAAADARDFPVLEVPFSTPYIAISEYVTTRLASEQLSTVQQAYDLQRQLTSAALAPSGRAEVVRLLANATASWIAVTTPHGTVLDSAPAGRVRDLRPLQVQLERARSQGAVSVDVAADGSTVAVHPLGTRRRARQLLVVASPGPPSTFDRMVVAGAVSLLSIDAERRLGSSPERRATVQGLGALALRRTVLPGDRLLALTTLGFSTDRPVTVGCLVVPSVPGDVLAEDLDGALADHDAARALVADVAAGGAHVLITETGPAELEPVLQELLSAVRHRGGSAGLSAPSHAAELPSALRQAEAAARHAVRTHARTQRYDRLTLHSTVLDALSSDVRGEVLEAVLAPLDRQRDGTDLIEALAAFLRHNGHVGAAAHEVAVHRQTFTRRLARCERVLGVSLGSADDRAALWLALSLRQLDL